MLLNLAVSVWASVQSAILIITDAAGHPCLSKWVAGTLTMTQTNQNHHLKPTCQTAYLSRHAYAIIGYPLSASAKKLSHQWCCVVEKRSGLCPRWHYEEMASI